MLKLMLLEDSRLVRPRLLAELSLVEGVTVVASAETIAECDVLIKELTPDVLVMDLSLPDGDAAASISRWRLQLPAAAILVHTNDVSEVSRARCLKAGATAYFDKSADISPLLLAVADCAAAL